MDVRVYFTAQTFFVWNALAQAHVRQHRQFDFGDKLLGTFIETNDRTHRIIGFFIQIEDIFHRRDKISTDLGDTPFQLLPGFEGVFLKASGWFHMYKFIFYLTLVGFGVVAIRQN